MNLRLYRHPGTGSMVAHVVVVDHNGHKKVRPASPEEMAAAGGG